MQATAQNPRYTAPEGQPLAGWKICVDAGHGGQIFGATRGYTGGTHSVVSDTTESDVNLRVSMFLWDLLTQAGADVVMTRTHETRLSADCLDEPGSDAWRASQREELNIRVRIAEANDCDMLVAVHHNAAGSSANFATAFYFDPDVFEGEAPVAHSPENVDFSRRLAQSIVNHLGQRMQIDTREARHGNYHVLRECSLPAVISEGSFMTNPEEAAALDDWSRNRLEAIGLFEAILETCGGTN